MDANEGRKVDAVRCPHSFKGAGPAATRLHRLQDKFGPVLGGKVFHRNQGDHSYLVHDDNKDHSLYFPTDHPRAGEERYEWVDKGHGVKYGYLKPEKPEDEDDVQP